MQVICRLFSISASSNRDSRLHIQILVEAIRFACAKFGSVAAVRRPTSCRNKQCDSCGSVRLYNGSCYCDKVGFDICCQICAVQYSVVSRAQCHQQQHLLAVLPVQVVTADALIVLPWCSDNYRAAATRLGRHLCFCSEMMLLLLNTSSFATGRSCFGQHSSCKVVARFGSSPEAINHPAHWRRIGLHLHTTQHR